MVLYPTGGTPPEDEIAKVTHVSNEEWHQEGLAIVIVGASGDLAKKKTFPSLLSLFAGSLLPRNFRIYGYARSHMTDDALRDRIRPYLTTEKRMSEMAIHLASPEKVVEDFLSRVFYQAGSGYGDLDSWHELNAKITIFEEGGANTEYDRGRDPWFSGFDKSNRLFYFAIPPNIFAETGTAIKAACMAPKGWSRMIVEKPFGRDLESCKEILKSLGQHFDETDMFRIDHYLGKEMVQNLSVLRFGNLWLENMMNRNYVQCIMLTFKEDFGTEGR